MTIKSGYLLGDVWHATIPDYLVAVVREDYANGKFEADELEPRLDAALVGDHARATDSPFMPMLLALRHG